jgi:hypothetical protein
VEKISHIVRGSPRVASVDLKNAPAVRPGTPSYGRPIGESPATPERTLSTASRAAALQTQLNEHRHSDNDRVVQQMADQFFMSRIRRPQEEHEFAPSRFETAHGSAADADMEPGEGHTAAADADDVVQRQPEGYKPRGSYVDVRA